MIGKIQCALLSSVAQVGLFTAINPDTSHGETWPFVKNFASLNHLRWAFLPEVSFAVQSWIFVCFYINFLLKWFSSYQNNNNKNSTFFPHGWRTITSTQTACPKLWTCTSQVHLGHTRDVCPLPAKKHPIGEALPNPGFQPTLSRGTLMQV